MSYNWKDEQRPTTESQIAGAIVVALWLALLAAVFLG